MKKLNEILKKKVAVFTFGRMNPPTIGHEKLINKIIDVAKKVKGDPFIFVSKTQDAQKNPLSLKNKAKYIRLAFPKLKNSIIADPEVITPFSAIHELIRLGYTDLIMIVGQDRVKSFKSAVSAYIPHPDEKKSLNLNSFDVISAGTRDPDSDNISGMSASKMREYAHQNDFDSFKSGVMSNISDKYAKEMFDKVKAGLNIVEQLQEQISRPKNSLGISRKDMPQIRRQYIKNFVDFLRADQIKVVEKKIEVSKLKPTQNEINLDKVKLKYDEFSDSLDSIKPFIVSSDYHILDGHHQLFALKNIDKNMKVSCYFVDYPMLGIIEYAKSFPKTSYKSINEEDEVQRTKERQARELETIKDRHFDELQVARLRDYENKKAEKDRNESVIDFGENDDYIYEYLEDGTIQLVTAYIKDTPGQ